MANTLEYDPTVSISRVDCTQNRPICQEFEVKGYPTLLWIVDGKKADKYSGARSMEAFKAYIELHAAKAEEEKEDEIEATVQEAGVLHLTGENFNHAIEKGVTIVKFFAPWYVHGEENSFQHFVKRNQSDSNIISMFSHSGAVTANVCQQHGMIWLLNLLAIHWLK